MSTSLYASPQPNDPVVDVYRNLGQPGVCYSLRSTGARPRVFDRRNEVVLGGVIRFIVQHGGQRRARHDRQRNVHAWVRGTVLEGFECDPKALAMRQARYNCFELDGFCDLATGAAINKAELVVLNAGGLWYLPSGTHHG